MKKVALFFLLLLPFFASATIKLSHSGICATNEQGTISTYTISLSSSSPLTAWISATKTSRPQDVADSFSTLSVPRPLSISSFTLPSNSKFLPDQIFIKLAKGSTIPEQFSVIRSFSLIPNLFLVRLPSLATDNAQMEALIRSLAKYPQIISAYPNYITEVEGIINSEKFDSQWGLNNYGQKSIYADGALYSGRKNCDISALDTWDTTIGRRDIIVAVIDSGVNYMHEDLRDNMWRNPGEIPGNGIDDDNNGYIDDIYGISPVENTSDPMDYNGHGTHCAGIIAASALNQEGIVGTTWNTQIMALKYLADDGLSRGEEHAIECIEYAVENGARILSCSWGGDGKGAIGEALQAAVNAGVVVSSTYTGKQYIDTGITNQNNLTAEFIIAIKELPSSQQATILGAYQNYNEAYIASITTEGTWSGSLSNLSSSLRPSVGSITEGQVYHLISSISNNKNITLSVDGTELFSTEFKSSGTTKYNLFLLARNENGSKVSRYCVATIYSAKIYINGTIVRNFVPSLNNLGEAGLYDTVSEHFYKSLSNKPFEAGRELPKQNTFQDKFYEAQETQTPLEAIEFPQTQSTVSGMKVSLNETCDITWDAEEVAKLIPIIAPSGYIAHAFVAQDGTLCARLADAPVAEMLSKTDELLSISISNPIPTFWYAISASDTPTGPYTLILSTLKQAVNGESITLSLQTTKKNNFIRLTMLNHR